ncbi:MAG: molybdenum cofactor biosynthesis protein MoaE [Aquificota bacterium]
MVDFPRVVIDKTIPDLKEVFENFNDPTAGGVVIFEGRPRNDNSIVALFYEAYLPMALKELEKLRKEALEKFPVKEIFIFHRVGKIKVGETSFRVIVFAPHRREAFECCSWVVDRVKERVPIWKKEIYPSSEGDWILGSSN